MKLTENQIRRIVRHALNEIHQDMSNEVLKTASKLGLNLSNPSLKNAIYWLVKSKTRDEFDKSIKSMFSGLSSYIDDLKSAGIDANALSRAFLPHAENL